MVAKEKCVDKPVSVPKVVCPDPHPYQRHHYGRHCHVTNDLVCKRVPRHKCGYRERELPRCMKVPKRVCEAVPDMFDFALDHQRETYSDDHHEVEAEPEEECKTLPPKEVCAKVKFGVPKKVPVVRPATLCKIPKGHH